MTYKELKTKFNIGDIVMVTHRTDMGYDEKGQRCVCITELDKPLTVAIVGAVRRHLGQYHKGSRPSWDGEGDFEPPSLSVNGTVLLLQVRQGMMSKMFDVDPAHVMTVDQWLACGCPSGKAAQTT